MDWLQKNTRYTFQCHQPLPCLHPGKASHHSPTLQCDHQPWRPAACSVLLPCHVFLPTEKCPEAESQPLSPFAIKALLLCPVSFTQFSPTTAKFGSWFQPPYWSGCLFRTRGLKGFWRCLVFSFNGWCFKDFSEHPAGARGSKGNQSVLICFISSQASSGFKNESLSSHQPDLDQFTSPLKMTLPILTLVTLILATLTVLPLIPTHASCTQPPLGPP